MPGWFAHETAEVSKKAVIGEGTKIWNHAQIREEAIIGSDCIISKNVYVDCGVRMGSRCKIQNNVSVYRGVEMGDDVFIGPGVCFTNDLYPRAAIWDEDRLMRTYVKDGASIGANSTIICSNTIGEHAMIGAGSVVTCDIPPHALAYGNPARIMGYVCICSKMLDETGYCGGCGRKVGI